jgi:hypothetical protein
MAFPATTGTNLVCTWSDSDDAWVANHYILDTNNVAEFQAPSWDQWYWVGVWEVDTGSYVYGMWIGNFLLTPQETNEEAVESVSSSIPPPPIGGGGGSTNPPPPVVILTDPYPPRKIVHGRIFKTAEDYLSWDLTSPVPSDVYYKTNLLYGAWEIISTDCWGRFYHNNPEGFYKVVPEVN